MSEITGEQLIHDLAIVLGGALHPSAQIGPAPRMAARRLRDALGITPGELRAGIEDRINAALSNVVVAPDPHEYHTVDGPLNCSRCQLLRDNAHWMATGEIDGQLLDVPGRMSGAAASRFEPEDAATVAGQVMREFPGDRQAPGRILDAGGHRPTAEHLALTGPALRDHLKASPSARGHGVPQLARNEAAVGGMTGLVNLHRARHAQHPSGSAFPPGAVASRVNGWDNGRVYYFGQVSPDPDRQQAADALWSCPHQHAASGDAECCAQAEIDRRRDS